MAAMKERVTRSIERELVIEAPAEAVWKALTDADELTRWFPLQAEAEPGVGGKQLLSWGPGMEGISRITAWKPNEHLQTTWSESTEQMKEAAKDAPAGSWAETAGSDDWQTQAKSMLVDYFLEAQGGKTVLRLVHSGFGIEERWDDEFESHGRGWSYELGSLRHYLERHRGKPRKNVWLRVPLEVPAEKIWARLLGADGLAKEGNIADAPDKPYKVRTVHGDELKGTVQLFQPPLQLALAVENRNASLIRFGVETCFGPPEANMWLSAWDLDDAEMDAFKTKWETTLKELAA